MDDEEWDRTIRDDRMAAARGCLSALIAALIVWAFLFWLAHHFGIRL